jgi:hypothetical protein
MPRVKAFMDGFNIGELAVTPFDVTADAMENGHEPVGGDPGHTLRYLLWFDFGDPDHNSWHKDVMYYVRPIEQPWSQQVQNTEQMIAMNVGLYLEEELRKLAKTDAVLCFVTVEKQSESMHESTYVALHSDRLIVGVWGIMYEEETRHFKTGVRIGTVGLQDSMNLTEETEAYDILATVNARDRWIAIVGVPYGVAMETGEAAGTYSWESVYHAIRAELVSGTPPGG